MNQTLWDFCLSGPGKEYRKSVPDETGSGSFAVNEVPAGVYSVEDMGTYTYEGGALTVTNANGLEMTAEGDPMKLHYVTAVSDQLTGDFTINAADLDV